VPLAGGLAPEVALDALTQEVNLLKKDLATAERLAKQADANCKTKDAQLKRSAEAIVRLKEQLATNTDDARVKILKVTVLLIEVPIQIIYIFIRVKQYRRR
jgi:predicted  nucleic acid-binding Zn-ribbon protein